MSTRRESDVAISDGAGARGAGTVRSDLALGVRLTTGGGSGTWFRLILSAIGIGLCATVLLLAASFGPALDSRQMRTDGVTPHYMGVENKNGRLVAFISRNCDMGDAWEWINDPVYPVKYGLPAYKVGINVVIYAMSH